MKIGKLMADKLENYLHVDSGTKHSPAPAAAQPAITPPAPKCQVERLYVLSSQWITLLESGHASDMTILLEGIGGSALPLLGGDGEVPYHDEDCSDGGSRVDVHVDGPV